ncbi:hypothetical protein ACCO45_010562 [Purpureocillium lilacinum]|uniref:Uncharacterized protein n=1 Tax=Purpureocillium lilacinum TaxID=33203 RepID=A0ACC4DGM9_PURLI
MGAFTTREGVTIDAVAATARRWLLNPKATLLLALGLRWKPIFSRLVAHVPVARVEKLRARASMLAAVALALAFNDFLNRKLANNWVSDTRWDWDHEIVVVTGGSSGLGASITQRLLARNARTRIVVIDFQPLRWTPPRGSRLRYYQCDLSDSTALRATCARIKDEVGHPSVLFNNAGLARGYTVMEGRHADVEVTMKTNLIAPFLLVKEFLPEMVRRDHGHIINTGSMSSVVPPPNIVDYAATKAGLTALHEGLQLELKYSHHAPRVRLTLGVFSYIQTPIISGTTNQPNFLFPLLDVESVSERLVDTVYSGLGATIYMPGIMRFITSLKGGPEWLFRLARERSVHSDLDFTGRQDVDSKERFAGSMRDDRRCPW